MLKQLLEHIIVGDWSLFAAFPSTNLLYDTILSVRLQRSQNMQCKLRSYLKSGKGIIGKESKVEVKHGFLFDNDDGSVIAS